MERFGDPASYRAHYETIASRIASRIEKAGAGGEFRDDLGEIEAWAVMGMDVFAGLRYVVWRNDGDPDPSEVARRVNRLLAKGVSEG